MKSVLRDIQILVSIMVSRADLQTRLMTKEGGFDEEREELLRQLKDVRKKRYVSSDCNPDFKNIEK